MGAARWMRWANRVPPVARWAMILAVGWSLLLCLSAAPSTFFSAQLWGNGLCAAVYGAMLLGSRMDMRGVWMMPIWVAVAFTHSLWAIVAGTAAEAALTVLGLAGTRSAGVPLIIGIGAVLLLVLVVVNRHAWSLLPLAVGITLAAAFASFTTGSIRHSAWFGPCVGTILLGVLCSLAWGIVLVRARAASINAGRCPSCGYDASDVYTGPCPECGKYRDETKDGLL